MINKEVLVEYLDPGRWTHLGEVLHCLGTQGRILHILTENGDETGVWEDGSPAVLFNKEENTEQGISALWNQYPVMEEIRVYTLEGLKRYYNKVQSQECWCVDTDDYVKLLYRELEHTEGIRVYRRHKGSRLLERLTERLSAIEGAALLWVTKDDGVYFDLIAEVREGSLIRISTSDRYGGSVK